MPKKQYLEAGQIVGTHGVRGELRVQPWCDSPAQLAALAVLYLEGKPVDVSSRPHKNLVLMKMAGVDTVEAAAALRGKVLFLNRDDVDLDGRHFIQDLIGLQVVDADDGTVYGELTDVSATGANDVYHVLAAGREVLIPAIPDVVREIDVDGGAVRIRPLKGLFDDED